MTTPEPPPPPGYPPPGYPPPGYPPPGYPQPWYASPQVPAGYPAIPGVPIPPAPFTLLSRIPEDQPFVVRPSVRKRGIQLGALALFATCMFGFVIIGAGTNGAGGVSAGMAVLLVIFLAVFALALYSATAGGPVLAVGPHGLWIRTRPNRGQAIWLPWETVAAITTRRWSFDKNAVVKPYDGRVMNNLGTRTALAASTQQLLFGSGFQVSLVFSDRTGDEIMTALRHFSAGRCAFA